MTKLDITLSIITAFITVFLYFISILLKKGDNNVFFDFKKHYKQATKKQNNNTTYNGVFIGHQHKRDIYIPEGAKHIFCCGTTGSGKTVALSNFVKHSIDKDLPLLLIDGKGDIGAGSILDIVQTLKGNRKLYIINMNDPQNSDKYNPFQNSNATVIKDMLVNMTDWSEEHYKSNVERYLQKVIETMIQLNLPLSFQTIIDNMNIDSFSMLSKELTQKGLINKEQHFKNMELTKLSAKIIDGAIARFATIAESEIGIIFNNNGIDITTALKENAIILFILNPLLYPITSGTLGRLILIDSKKAVSNLFNINNKRTLFIMDEINVYASPVLLDLVNKSRSANITCILACQSLSDLEVVSESFKEQIIENTNNYIVMRQNSAKNAESWSSVLGTRKTMEATYQIKENQETNVGTLKRTREFIYHPDDIKTLKTGEAILLSKDNNFHAKIQVNKPF